MSEVGSGGGRGLDLWGVEVGVVVTTVEGRDEEVLTSVEVVVDEIVVVDGFRGIGVVNKVLSFLIEDFLDDDFLVGGPFEEIVFLVTG